MKITMKLLKDNHNKDVLHQLNKYRHSSHLCDVKIVVQGREFPAHRAVLAAGGGFFDGLFAAKMKEQSDNIVYLNQVDPAVMEDILSYIYTGEIELTLDNAQLVIMATDFLLLNEQRTEMDEFLVEAVRDNPPYPAELMLMYQFATQYKCELLQEEVLTLVKKDFEAVISESNVSEITAKTLSDVISCDDLVVRSEEVVFGAIVNWTKHKEERRISFYDLFKLVRLCSFSEEYLRSSILTENLVSSNPECVTLVHDHRKSKWLPSTPHEPRPRDCLDEYTDTILVFPTEHGGSNGPWCYVVPENAWFQFPVPDGFGFGIPVYYDGSVYLAKEDIKNEVHFVVDRYNLQTCTWSEVARLEMEETFWNYSVTCLNGILYVVGGEVSVLFPVEAVKYVFACDLKGASDGSPCSLTSVSSLNTARSHICLTSNKSHIYAFGGKVYDNPFLETTNVVQRYDPILDRWSYLSPMISSPRFSGQSVLVGDKIFLIQYVTFYEEDEEDRFAFDVYDINSDAWSELETPPISGAEDLDLLVLEKYGTKLFMLTRYDRGDLLDTLTTMIYDLELSTWSEGLPVHLSHPCLSLRMSGTSVRLPRTALVSLPLLKF